MGPWVLGSLGPWVLGSLGPWVLGSLGPWVLGSLGPWVLGSLGPWVLGSLGPWVLGSLGPWVLGSLGPWVLGSLGPWVLGSLGPWVLGSNIFFNETKFLSKTINNELAKLTRRFLANKLSINLKKSSYIIFRPRQKRQTLDLPVKINDNLIARAKETVFLGVILVENLSWKPHILNVSRKISKSIGIIYKAGFCPPSTALVTILYII